MELLIYQHCHCSVCSLLRVESNTLKMYWLISQHQILILIAPLKLILTKYHT